jgi:succinoglycan biosynthesis protein ExoV
MKLYYWEGINGKINFGDELNRKIWPQLIPDLLSNEADELFCGIGTLLNARLPKNKPLIVFGTGVGYGELQTPGNNTKIYCVRGPLSTQALNIDKKFAIVDPGVLIRRFAPAAPIKKKWKYAYMPHWINASNIYENIFNGMGWGYLNPLWDVEEILFKLQETECLVTEAMHGAIVADTLRIPWIPVIDDANAHSLVFKWNDWCMSVSLEYSPVKIPSLTALLSGILHGADTTLRDLQQTFKKIPETKAPVLSNENRLNTLISTLDERLEVLKASYSTDGTLNLPFRHP